MTDSDPLWVFLCEYAATGLAVFGIIGMLKNEAADNQMALHRAIWTVLSVHTEEKPSLVSAQFRWH